MQAPQENQSDVYDQQSNDTINQQSIKSKIAYNNLQMEKLSLDDNAFFSKIKQYNDTSTILIQQQNNRQALMYLSEAEKILEYGAMRGKTINRNLILCVLNNQAVAYQKQGVLQKAAKYIEALIYNIQTFIQDDNIPLQFVYSFDNASKEEQSLYFSILKRKNMLIRYYLIYCALMSQSRQHEIALQHSFKAMALLKQMFEGYSKYYKLNAFRQKDQRTFTAKKLRLLNELSNYKQNLQLHNYDVLFQRTQYVFKEWRQIKTQVDPEDKIQADVKDFSIAKVMQSQAQTFSQFDKPLDFSDQISMHGLIKKVLLFVINFFSVATEIRLINAPRYTNPEEKMKSPEFKRSELYHLTSIKIFCTYVPYQSCLIKHIQTNYFNHYKHELNIQNVEYVHDDQFLDQKKNSKSIINSDKDRYVSKSYHGVDEQQDLIKPIQKVVKKKKIVPELQIPKSPRNNNSKSKHQTSKKKIIPTKTPRKFQSPPLPTSNRIKEIANPNTPRLSHHHNISSSKVMMATVGFQKMKPKQTSRNKIKSKLLKQKQRQKIDTIQKVKSKSKSKSKTKIKTRQSEIQRVNSKKHKIC